MAVSSLAILAFLILPVPLLLRERPGEKLLPWMAGKPSPESTLLKIDSWARLLTSLKQVLLLPNGLLLSLGVFVILTAFAFIRTLLPIFTIQELGWSNESYSNIYAITTLVAGVVSMVIGGVLLDRFGKLTMLKIYLFSIACLTTLFIVSKSLWTNIYFVIGYISLFNLIFTLAVIGLFAISMQFCWKRISAIQFTFYMGLYNLGNTAGAAIIGPLRDYFSWQYTILAFSFLAILGMGILKRMHIQHHTKQLQTLEHNYLWKENLAISPG